jgi:stage V sporulation protein AB
MKLMSSFIGFAEGVVVGGAVVSFLTILDIVPRLCWVSRTTGHIFWYETAIVGGAVFASLAYFMKPWFGLGHISIAFTGLVMGIFIGLIAAALAEVMNVLPIVTRRIGIEQFIGYIFPALILGKVVGSIIYWIFPRIYK